jgi:hypothetical protein
MVEVYVERVGAVGDDLLGIDPKGVLLRFAYDPAAVAAVKQGLQRARAAGLRQPGVWLPTMRCWVVHWPAWPFVRAALRAGRYPLVAGVPPAHVNGGANN